MWLLLSCLSCTVSQRLLIFKKISVFTLRYKQRIVLEKSRAYQLDQETRLFFISIYCFPANHTFWGDSIHNRIPWLPRKVELLSCSNGLVSSIVRVPLQIIFPRPSNQYNHYHQSGCSGYFDAPFPKHPFVRSGDWWSTAHSQVSLRELSLAERSYLT